jgi:dihydroxyacetone kinase-like predicted kinase
MKEENEWITSGFICKAVRDTSADGVECIKGHYIQGVNGKLVGCDESLMDAVDDMLSHVDGIEDKETLFFFYGKSLNATQADEIANHIREKYPNLEVGAYEGKQDVYDLLVGIN